MTSFEKVATVVADEYAISLSDILSRNRKGPAMESRRMIMYILRNKYKWTFAKIGSKLNKDHTTIMHHYKKMAYWVQTDPLLYDEVVALVSKIEFDPMSLTKRDLINKILTEVIVWTEPGTTRINLEKLFKMGKD